MSSFLSIPPVFYVCKLLNHTPVLSQLCCFPARVQKGEMTCPELQPPTLWMVKTWNGAPLCSGLLGLLRVSPVEQALASDTLCSGLQPKENQCQQEINQSPPFSPSCLQLPVAFCVVTPDWVFCGPRISLCTTKMMETCLCWQQRNICFLD